MFIFLKKMNKAKQEIKLNDKDPKCLFRRIIVFLLHLSHIVTDF